MLPQNSGTLSDFEAKVASQVGYREGANNDTKYGRWYGLNHQPYCAMGLSWCSNEALTLLTTGKFASCFAWKTWAQKQGIWHEGYSGIRRGDIVVYTFSHVEYVRGTSSNYVYTTGFNTSSGEAGSQRNGDGVYNRVRAKNGTILGYLRPQYTVHATVKPKPSVKAPSGVTTKVKAFQQLLNVKADGQWGDNTDEWSMRLRTASRWHTGGGPKRKFREDKVQRVLGVHVDNAWGPKTQKAEVAWVKKAQKVLGVKADGAWGPATDKKFLALRKAAHNNF